MFNWFITSYKIAWISEFKIWKFILCSYYDLKNDGAALANKQIVMLDEHTGNQQLAEAIKKTNQSYFDYEVWQTDHPFTNKIILFHVIYKIKSINR